MMNCATISMSLHLRCFADHVMLYPGNVLAPSVSKIKNMDVPLDKMYDGTAVPLISLSRRLVGALPSYTFLEIN